MSTFTKDPNATLDYPVDWSKWLGAGETITGHTIEAVTGGIAIVSHDVVGEVVVVVVSGGTVGTTASFTCRITTSDARIDDRTVKLRIQQR